MQLIKLCEECRVHLTIMGSGLVYTNNKEIYDEEDKPDLINKVYTKYRVNLENILRTGIYNNVLYLRILYPCSFDNHEKCFYSKMKKRGMEGIVYNIDVPLTIIPYLFPKIPKLLDKNTIGILNFVNKGKINLIELLSYSDITNINIKEPEDNISNYELDVKKLENILEEDVLDIVECLSGIPTLNNR